MTFDEAKKLPRGTLVRLTRSCGMAAQIGATAEVIGLENSSLIIGAIFLAVRWIRNGLDGKQDDGSYHFEWFELASFENSPKIPCNCSTFYFVRFGCRYLRKTDFNGFLHS